MADDKDSLHDEQSDSDPEDDNEDKSLVGDAPMEADLLGNKLLSDEEEDDDDSQHRDGMETFQGYSSALSALPPTVISFEDNQFEVSSSPAFHELDKVSTTNIFINLNVDHMCCQLCCSLSMSFDFCIGIIIYELCVS